MTEKPSGILFFHELICEACQQGVFRMSLQECVKDAST